MISPTPSSPHCRRWQCGFDRLAYRQRTKVQQLVNRLKRHRAIATPYEKLAAHY